MLLAATASAVASDFPARPIRLIVPGTGQIDALARALGSKLTERLGQPTVIEHHLGAAGILAANRLAKATPDGHSLLLATTGFAISAALHSHLPYDAKRDFVGVAQVAIPTTVLVAAPSLGIGTVQELIALAKTAPGKVIFGSPGPGSGPHLAGERFRLASGIRILHVGMKSGQITIETITGRIHYSFMPLGSILPLLKDGQLTALAVLTPQRSPVLPHVPTITESLPTFGKPLGSFGLLAPAGTPRERVRKLADTITSILALPDVDAWMRGEGLIPAPAADEDYDRILHAQIDAFAALIAEAGVPRR
jgi:tripartite-type tricarboxylate transporter receptor subunit TctC